VSWHGGAGVARDPLPPAGRIRWWLNSSCKACLACALDLGASRRFALLPAVTTDPALGQRSPPVLHCRGVIGGLEPARSLILMAIAAGKSVVTANKAVIARHGEEIAAAAAARGVYVLIEGRGWWHPDHTNPEASLGGTGLRRVSGASSIGTTKLYILQPDGKRRRPYAHGLPMPRRWGMPKKPTLPPMWEGAHRGRQNSPSSPSLLPYGGAVDSRRHPCRIWITPPGDSR